MSRPIGEACLSLFNPISRAVVPLIDGIARRRLFHDGATQHETQLNGITINYYHQAPQQPAAGSHAAGVPLLLVHGIADSALTWSLVVRSLACDHDVYVLDLPGYGLSGLPAGRSFATLDEMREVLALFLHQVIGRPALIVGNSMGGWLAAKLAWEEPEQVHGVVLINAGGAPLQGRSSWEPFAEMIALPDLRTTWLTFRQMFGIIPRPLLYLAIPRPLLYLGLRGFQDMFQRRVVREFVAALVASMQEDDLLRAADLRQLPVPAALIWGLADRFLPQGSREFFQSNLPAAPTLLLPRCGHLPQRERPHEVIQFIRRCVEQFAGDHVARRMLIVQRRAEDQSRTPSVPMVLPHAS